MAKMKPEIVKEFMYRGKRHRLVRVDREEHAFGDYHYNYVVDCLGIDSAGDPAWHPVAEFAAIDGSNESFLLRAMGVAA